MCARSTKRVCERLPDSSIAAIMGRMATETKTETKAASVLSALRSKGTERTRATYARHGLAPELSYGVSVADMKLIAKPIRGDQELAYELYDSGVTEAMYLAGIVASGAKMTEARLESWARGADGRCMISDFTVPWVTVEHPQATQLAMEWIRSTDEYLASSGWSTYSGLVMTRPDQDLDLKEVEALLAVIAKSVHGANNRVRSAMNSFVIAVGTYVTPLSSQAKATARQIGHVSVDVGDTACKIPVALAYIEKAEQAGKVGKKRKTIRC